MVLREASWWVTKYMSRARKERIKRVGLKLEVNEEIELLKESLQSALTSLYAKCT